MLKDLVPQFAEVAGELPNLVMDNYQLKDGLYIRLSLGEQFSITHDDYVVIQKNEEEKVSKSTLLRWFKIRDSYSSVLNDVMNKAVDIPAKKIHSTNYLSLFAKTDYLLGEAGKRSGNDIKSHLLKFLQVLLPKSQERLFDLYPVTAKKKTKRQKEIDNRELFFQENYPALMQYLLSHDRAEKQQAVIKFWDEYFDTFREVVKDLANEYKISNYIKVFFDAEEIEYQKEYEAYVLPRIFNVNDYNQFVDGEIVGLPAYDVSMNSKKPFFELKTMKTKVPIRLTLEDALHVKDLYKWLQKQGKFKELMLPFHELFGPTTDNGQSRDLANAAYHLSLDKNGSIQHFENVPFKPRTNWRLEIENVLRIHEKTDDIWMLKKYPDIEGKGQLRGEISRLFFGKYLPNNLLDPEAPKAKEGVFTMEMVSIYVMVRQALFDFLVKDTDDTIRPFLKRYSLQSIENQLLITTEGLAFRKMANAFQLRLALLKKIGDREGKELSDIIKETYELLQSKLSKRNELTICESDEEFFFLAGQVGYYLLAQSEAANKTYGLAEPILKARNPRALKNKLADLFDTYSHAIKYDYVAFRTALAMLQGYETNVKIEGKNKNMLLAGLLANNLFFQKRESEPN